MARPPVTAALIAVLLTAGAAGPALAQFPFGEPPRPPGDVPRTPSDLPARPSRPPGPPPNFPSEPPPGAVQGPGAAVQPRPPGGAVQSQPLPPPPGASELRPQQEPGEDPRAPGQQPHNAPQQPASTAPQPSDEVVTEMPSQKITNPTAVFAGLDKITGRTISFDVAINETVQFGALQVTPRVCYTRPPTETPNTDAFAEVEEVTLQGEIRRIFAGWMFAASPGLHGVEHPIYDVWLTDCKGGAQAQTAVAEPPPAPAPPPTRPAGSQAGRPAGQAPRAGAPGGNPGRPSAQAPQAQQQQPGIQPPPGAQPPPPGSLPPPPRR